MPEMIWTTENGMERVLLQSTVDQVGGEKLAESGSKKES